MARFTGKAYKGATRDVRRLKRAEAVARNKATPAERRRKTRVTADCS